MMQAGLIDTEINTLRVLGGISGTARPARLPTSTTQLSSTWLSGKKHACLTDTHLPALLLGLSASGIHTNALSFAMRQAATAVADCPSKVGWKVWSSVHNLQHHSLLFAKICMLAIQARGTASPVMMQMASASMCCITTTSRDHNFGRIVGEGIRQSVVLAPLCVMAKLATLELNLPIHHSCLSGAPSVN